MSLDIGRQAYARFFWRIAWLCASLLGMAHTDLTLAEAQLLTHLEVRLIHPDERVRWEQLLCEQHYLHNAQLVGEVLRYGATTPDGQWMALLGWASAALHLRPRDRWLAWSEAQRAARLPLIAQNSRFLLLTERTKFPNLASRALALCTRRLADDWRAAFGHTVLVAETFVDPERFAGTWSKAAGGRCLGPTGGFARDDRDFDRDLDAPKQLWVCSLHPKALAWLRAERLPEPLAAQLPQTPPRCPYKSAELSLAVAAIPRTADGPPGPPRQTPSAGPHFDDLRRRHPGGRKRPQRFCEVRDASDAAAASPPALPPPETDWPVGCAP